MSTTDTDPTGTARTTAARAGSGAVPGPASLTRREATVADVPALVALVESAYRGEDSRAGWTTEADLLGGQRMDADMARELGRV